MSKANQATQLILWRHAEAEDGFVDSARQLTERGQKQAARVARWLATRLPGDYRLIASPAVRAQQTASALAEKFASSAELAVSSSATRILAASQWPGCGGTTVLVGHQPCLGQLAALLVTGREESWSIRKGAIWWLWRRRTDTTVSIRTIIDPDMI